MGGGFLERAERNCSADTATKFVQIECALDFQILAALRSPWTPHLPFHPRGSLFVSKRTNKSIIIIALSRSSSTWFTAIALNGG
jgi:hypothetical protein